LKNNQLINEEEKSKRRNKDNQINNVNRAKNQNDEIIIINQKIQ
jgi:hypothetical protein